MTNQTRPGLYRARNGMIFGVCKGLANYFDVKVRWVRIATVGLLVFTGLWPVTGLYILAALIMKPEPIIPFASDADQEFYDSYASSRSMGLERIKRKFKNLDKRIRRMEHTVTSKDFDWERRFRSGK